MLFNFNGIVIFDEFQWFQKINPAFPFDLQRYWDMRQRKPTVIISGSIIGMVKKLFEEHGAPLYGRADIKIDLKPLKINAVSEILKDLGIASPEEQIKFYLVFGGIPYYYSLMWKYSIKSLDEALIKLVFEDRAPLREELEAILREAFGREHRTYAAILVAISDGATKLTEIANKVGLKATSLVPYLRDLDELLDLIRMEKILGRRKGRLYHINDYFTRFWFRYVYRNRSTLEYDWKKVYEKCVQTVNSYFGECFEILSHEILVMMAEKGKLPLRPTSVTKYYGRRPDRKVFDIDLIAYDEITGDALLVETKWKKLTEKEVHQILYCLIENSNYIGAKIRRKIYGIIAKRIEYKDKLKSENIFLIDIEDIISQ